MVDGVTPGVVGHEALLTSGTGLGAADAPVATTDIARAALRPLMVIADRRDNLLDFGMRLSFESATA
ncbi:unannotated protein [freshwater metagenome]|uniref:Unannotated protein n=1 Tax=freshwater metagenome TaxID=449393 RepID=A0A6J7SI32_9ZZZZ